jgi:hypothetical protein
MAEILSEAHTLYLRHVKAAQVDGLLCCVCASCEDYRADIRGSETWYGQERSELFVAIRHAIPLDRPWRGEALDLIFRIFTGGSDA